MVIDLSLMKGIRVDPDARTARVQTGVLLGELDKATQAYALAVPTGIVPTPESPGSRWAAGSVEPCASTD